MENKENDLNDAVWFKISDNYMISSHGDVLSCGGGKRRSEKKLKPYIRKDGYAQVSLCNKGKAEAYLVHRLVATHFLKKNDESFVVNHKDGNRLNNHYSNLEWVSQRENVCHSCSNRITSSNYIGVEWHKKKNKWIAKLSILGKQKYLGLFNSEIEAYYARREAEKNNGILNRYI